MMRSLPNSRMLLAVADSGFGKVGHRDDCEVVAVRGERRGGVVVRATDGGD